jgi:hypothetical protein
LATTAQQIEECPMIRAFALRPLSLTGALAAAALLAACGGQSAAPASNFTPVPVTPVIGDVPIGSPDAPLELVEYAALTCHVCRDFAKQIFPRLKATYIDTGKVRLPAGGRTRWQGERWLRRGAGLGRALRRTREIPHDDRRDLHGAGRPAGRGP